MPNQAGNPGNRNKPEEKEFIYTSFVAKEAVGAGTREDWAEEIRQEWPQRFPANPVPPCPVRQNLLSNVC